MATSTPSGNRVDRVEWADIAKAIAIIMVVWNHASTGVTHAPLPPAVLALTEFVHLFNVSSFFVVAGLFVCRSVKTPVSDYTWRMFRMIYYPMVLWSILQGTIYALSSGYVEEAMGLYQPLITSWYAPHKQLSFLMSLLAGRYVFLLADRLRIPWWGVGLTAGVAAIIQGLNWQDPLWFPIDPAYLVIMAAGAGITALGAQKRLATIAPGTALALSAIGITAAAGLVATWPGSVYASYFNLAGVRILAVTAVVFLSIFLAKTGRAGWLVNIGKQSLPIFLAHLIITGGTRIFLLKILGIEDVMALAVLCFLPGLLGPMIMVKVIGRRWIFEFPADPFGGATAPRRPVTA